MTGVFASRFLEHILVGGDAPFRLLVRRERASLSRVKRTTRAIRNVRLGYMELSDGQTGPVFTRPVRQVTFLSVQKRSPNGDSELLGSSSFSSTFESAGCLPPSAPRT